MENIVDSIISISTNKTKERSVVSSFIYNKYSNSETTNEDSLITNNLKSNKNDIKNKFIRLKLSKEMLDLDLDLDEFTLNVPELYNIAKIFSLDSADLLYFNRQINYNNKRDYHIFSLDETSVRNAISYLAADEEISNLDTNKIRKTSVSAAKISTLKDEDLNLNLLNNNNIFSNNDIFLENNLINNVESQVSQSNQVKNGFMFNTFKPIKKFVNSEGFLTFAEKNGVRCGFLLEKFKLVDGDYIRVSSRFFTKKKSERNLENLPNMIEDEAVQYGKTYKYIISDVYLYAYPDVTNRFVLNYYLLCDNPCMTKDIECRENEKPPPPLNIKFMYNQDQRQLEINWQEPRNYQYDAKGYQILKRQSVSEPFTVIKQLEGHYRYDDYKFREIVDADSKVFSEGVIPYSCIDKTYEPGRITIYAIRTIDAHGHISDYSEQLAILYDPFEEELIVDLVSTKGAKRDYPNSKIKKKSIFFKNKVDIVDNLPIVKNPSKISLYITPEFGGYSKSLNSNIKLIDENYQFSITKLNSMTIHKEKFKITNFNLS